MTKKQRQALYDKHNGLCYYTGKPLDETWQVDHIWPRSHPLWYQPLETLEKWGVPLYCNHESNTVPCLRIVNHYKRSLDLEGFRRYMVKFHIRLGKLPKKTRVTRTANRVLYMLKVADAFDITVDKPFSGKFYFETI